MRRGVLVALSLALTCLAVAPAHASPEDVANDIATKVMSPFCPGVTLENCPSDKAVALRARIEAWAEKGWDEERIMSELVDLYGEPIRAVPPKSGAGLWAWILPGLALLSGVVIATVVARRWTRRPDAPKPEDGPAAMTPDARARVNEELDAMRARP